MAMRGRPPFTGSPYSDASQYREPGVHPSRRPFVPPETLTLRESPLPFQRRSSDASHRHRYSVRRPPASRASFNHPPAPVRSRSDSPHRRPQHRSYRGPPYEPPNSTFQRSYSTRHHQYPGTPSAGSFGPASHHHPPPSLPRDNLSHRRSYDWQNQPWLATEPTYHEPPNNRPRPPPLLRRPRYELSVGSATSRPQPSLNLTFNPQPESRNQDRRQNELLQWNATEKIPVRREEHVLRSLAFPGPEVTNGSHSQAPPALAPNQLPKNTQAERKIVSTIHHIHEKCPQGHEQSPLERSLQPRETGEEKHHREYHTGESTEFRRNLVKDTNKMNEIKEEVNTKDPLEMACFTEYPFRPDYCYIPRGNKYITRTAKRLAKEDDKTVYIVRNHSVALGIQVPRKIHELVIEHERATRETRAHIVNANHQRERKKALRCLNGMFKKLPHGTEEAIIERAWETELDGVGRTQKICLPERLRRAAIAHIRHHHTDYDGRMEKVEAKSKKKFWSEKRLRKKKNRVVKKIAADIENVWTSWKPLIADSEESLEDRDANEFLGSRRGGVSEGDLSEDEVKDEDVEEEEEVHEQPEEAAMDTDESRPTGDDSGFNNSDSSDRSSEDSDEPRRTQYQRALATVAKYERRLERANRRLKRTRILQRKRSSRASTRLRKGFAAEVPVRRRADREVLEALSTRSSKKRTFGDGRGDGYEDDEEQPRTQRRLRRPRKGVKMEEPDVIYVSDSED